MAWGWGSSQGTTPTPTTTSTTTTSATLPTPQKPESQQPASPPPPPPPTQQPPPPPNDNPATDFETAFPHLAPQPSTAPSTPHDPNLPSTMSCRQAFDSAFYCSSLGGHFNDLYRFGTLRSCSEHWADWRFCMRIKTLGGEAKAAAVQDRYREKEERLKSGPNSEDVWTRRGPGEGVERPFGRAGEV